MYIIVINLIRNVTHTVYEILVSQQIGLRPNDALVLEKRPERNAKVHEGHEG